MDKKQVIGEVAAEQLTKWKAKYGKVYTLPQEDQEGNTHVTYVCKPTLEQWQNASRFLADDIVKTGKMLLNDCRLGGSDKVQNDAEFKAGVIMKMISFFQPVAVGEIKEV